MRVDFYSQAMAPDGSSIAQFASQAIKDSTLIPRHVMLREALQNSCDQRINKVDPIDFFVAAEKFTGKKLLHLKNVLEAGLEKNDPLKISQVLERDSIEVLYFADTGTKGLGGVTDASKPNVGNFAKYFYIFGRMDEIGSTDGGAFGAGRTTLNNASEISTVLVFSRFQNDDGSVGSRFMGMANGKAFEHDERMYTGRHWWCDFSNGKSPQPFEGETALNIASKLGMTEFLGDKTGFVALIVSPSYISKTNPKQADHDRRELLLDLKEAAYLYGWPHMVEISNKQSVYFHFIIDGNLLQNENPKNLGHLVNFVEEYERALRIRDTRDYSNNLENTKIIYAASNRDSSPIGILNWKYAPFKPIDIDYEEKELIPLNSVAFIRNAGFVVKYEKVTPYADNILTRGIFLVDPSHEKDFRSAEPIAHDDWIPARMGLQKGERNPVKKAIEEIRSTFRSANDSQNLNTSGQPLLFVSNVLGAVIGGSPMVGSISNQNKTKSSRLTPGKLSFSQIDEPYVVSSNNQVYKASFLFQLQKPQKLKTNYNVTIKAKIAIIGGTVESESPALGYQPVITNIGLDENEIFNSLSNKSINSKTINLSSSSLPDTLTVIIECKHGLAVMCLIETQGID